MPSEEYVCNFGEFFMSECFENLLCNLESLSLHGICRECFSRTLNAFIKVIGKRGKRSKRLRERVTPSIRGSGAPCHDDGAFCSQHLPMRKFCISHVRPFRVIIIEQPDEQLQGLLHIDPSSRAPIHSGALYIGKSKSWTDLSLHEMEKVCASDFDKLKECLSFMPCLQHLQLSDVCLTAMSLRVLLPVISRMENIHILDFGNPGSNISWLNNFTNRLQRAGRELSQILRTATNLHELDLAETDLDDEDLRQLSLNLPSKLKLSKLNLAHNCFGSQGLINLSGLLKHTPMLTELDLSENWVCQLGVVEFISALRYISLLEVLSITPADEESFILLAEGFRHLPKLQRLSINQECLFGIDPVRVTTAETIVKNLVFLPELQELHIPEISSEGNQVSGIIQACTIQVTSSLVVTSDKINACSAYTQQAYHGAARVSVPPRPRDHLNAKGADATSLPN